MISTCSPTDQSSRLERSQVIHRRPARTVRCGDAVHPGAPPGHRRTQRVSPEGRWTGDQRVDKKPSPNAQRRTILTGDARRRSPHQDSSLHDRGGETRRSPESRRGGPPRVVNMGAPPGVLATGSSSTTTTGSTVMWSNSIL